jgi:hypothetical protein
MPTIVIRDKQTGQEFEGPTGTPFDPTKYELVGSEGYGTLPVESKPFKEQAHAQMLGEHPGAATFLKTLATGARLAGPFAGSRFGTTGQALAGMGSEALAQTIEQPLTPLDQQGYEALPIAVGGALPLLSRLARGVNAGVRGGGKLMERGLQRGGDTPVNVQPIIDKATMIRQRRGTPIVDEKVEKLLENIGNRPVRFTPQGPMAKLREVENVRREAGRAARTPAARPEGKMLGGAAKGIERQAAEAGVPGAGDLLKGIARENARYQLAGMPGLRETLITGMLGGGGALPGLMSGDYRQALLGLLLGAAAPRALRAGHAVGAAPIADAAATGAGLTGLDWLLRQ